MRRPLPWTPVLIALGSNLGDRKEHLDHAVRALRDTPAVRVEAVSRYRETRPVGGPPQGDFLNAALAARTTLAPRDLLALLLEIERQRGRVRDLASGPRTLDLDLILYSEQIIDEPGLVVPHPRAHQRRFVLAPAAEVAGAMRHPTLGLTIAELDRRLAEQPAPAVESPLPAADRTAAPGDAGPETSKER